MAKGRAKKEAQTGPALLSLELLADAPLGAEDKSRDRLELSAYADVLAGAALGTPGPFTIGVFGEWGTGKTSLMHLVEGRLRESNEEVATVWFNAWRYEREAHPIVPLVSTMLVELESHKKFLARAKSLKRSLINALRAVLYGFSARSTAVLPGLGEVELGVSPKAMIDRFAELDVGPLVDDSLYLRAFDVLSAVPLQTKGKVVVFIDDLDRCMPDRAIGLLESLKLVLAQPGFVFVLGVAREVLEGYLSHRYSEQYGLKDFDGSAYLDKIVQLPFYIPSHRPRMGALSEALLESLAEADQATLRDILPMITLACADNPRSAIRFVNNLIIDKAIVTALRTDGLPLWHFAILRALQQRWRAAYALLLSSDELCARMAAWQDADLEALAVAEPGDAAERAATDAATLLLRDPALKELLLSERGREWLTDHATRRAAHLFLRSERSETTGATPRYDAYLSFQRGDRSLVVRVAEILRDHGLSVVMEPFAATTGRALDGVIADEIERSRAFVYFIGPTHENARWSARELAEALGKQRSGAALRIILVLLPGAELSEVPRELLELGWFDLREGVVSEEILGPLTRRLLYLSGRGS